MINMILINVIIAKRRRFLLLPRCLFTQANSDSHRDESGVIFNGNQFLIKYQPFISNHIKNKIQARSFIKQGHLLRRHPRSFNGQRLKYCLWWIKYSGLRNTFCEHCLPKIVCSHIAIFLIRYCACFKVVSRLSHVDYPLSIDTNNEIMFGGRRKHCLNIDHSRWPQRRLRTPAAKTKLNAVW